jgi:GDP-L-fucose synthase
MCLPLQRYTATTQATLSHLNVGTGQDVSIRELAEIIRDGVGCDAEIKYNPDYPDGTPQKLLDVSTLSALGWTATIDLKDGIRATYDWYRQQEHIGQ